MPEGDTIARAAATLHTALAGQPVTHAESALADVATAFAAGGVVGRTVERVTSHGKHLAIVFSGDLVLRTHMRMHGAWHLYRPGERWRRAAHRLRIRLDTPPWVALAFDVYDAEVVAGAAERVPAIARLGPDLLAPEVDVPMVAARIRGEGARPLGDVLLDQGVAAGIGNVFRSEVLFLEGLHPRTPADAITTAQAEALVKRTVRLLRLNARPGAGRRITTGRLAPTENLWVYQRTGRPCRRCGTPIQSWAEMPVSRRVYWCATCQPAPAHGDA